MGDVTVDIGGLTLAAATTRNSVERLQLAEAGEAALIIKATEVLVGKEAV